jgi:hypothetical protein
LRFGTYRCQPQCLFASGSGIAVAISLDGDPAALKSFLFTPEFRPVTVLAGVAILVVCLLCFHPVTRLRCAFFHCLIHQIREIRPAWALYRIRA